VQWLEANHYLECCPAGWVYLFEFIEGKSLIGGMLVGRPTAATYNPDRILQLHRMCFIDGTEPFVESRGLAMMRKHVRVWVPQIKGLISYSDPAEGHKGTVYEADNWCPLGLTQKRKDAGWTSRPGRRDRGPSTPKMRWFRTP
jgi:hypothetical protein